jgi:hypothetical protein
MKKLKVLGLLLIFFSITLHGQYSVYVTQNKHFADFNVNISDNVIMEDIGVEISKNVILEDFTVSFTPIKSKADVIITDRKYSDFEVNIQKMFADIDIEASENVIMEDIGIEIVNNAYRADYLIYNETDTCTTEILVCSLLPIINKYLEDDKKIKGLLEF